jgi:polysaccharide chain length determinant protein (PEP-CTERM system associated)
MLQREWTPEDYIAILRRYWLLILTLGVLGALLGYGASRFIPNRYKSQATVLIEEPTVPTDFVRPVVTAGAGERLMGIRQQVLSRARLEPLIDEFGLFPLERSHLSTEALVARLQSAVALAPIKPIGDPDSNRLAGFSISFTWDDPKVAQTICSAIGSMFIQENLQLREQNSEQTTKFLNQQLEEAKARLDEQDSRLAGFKSRYIGYLPDEAQTNLNILAGLRSELDAATQAISRAQQDKSLAQSALAQQLASWQASQTGHNPDTYEEQLAALQTQLANLQAKYTNYHPDVIKAKIEIESLKKKIAESEAQTSTTDPHDSNTSSREPSQFRQLRVQIASYDQIIADKTKQQDRIQQEIKLYQDRVQSTPAIEQQYKELTRDYQTALDLYNDLLKKRAQSTMAADLERHQGAEQFRILDPASLPSSPSYPNRPLFGLGGFAGGLAVALGISFLLEMRDTSLRTERDVELLLQLPVLAMIPPLKISSQANSTFS